jgi:hypothetical protein
VITTPSGGSHTCNGQNDGANPNAGGTLSTQLYDAAIANSFAFDGTYDSEFSDYFITSIDTTTQTATQFWGLLQNFAFTPTGGCQTEIVPGQEGLWAFDAFNAVDFLKLTPQYQVVTPGTLSVTVTVTTPNGNPVAGAVVGGLTSNAAGAVVIPVPSAAGCYQFKATKSSYIRSNAFFLSVYGS